ncbi:MAG: TIGR00730 family Rossman fold protein [Desulfohalobiaceae bacterium]|nr:TIGR00730 family Rossman fold protein [Desulfohalobiaceae bacterium]
MTNTKFKRGPYPAASETARGLRAEAECPQLTSDSYKLAFQDLEFLLRDELRPTRMHLELLKPELILQEHNIESTIVVFGSARIPDPATARKELERLQQEPEKEKTGPAARQRLARAESRLASSRYYEEARKLGRLISRQIPNETKMVVITGGGPGIMEAANRGACDENQESIGLNIVLPREQAPNRYITPELSFQFHYFATRKMHFMMRAKGLVAFPGGYGTMEELFETLTLLQTRKIQSIPVILFGREFWNRIVNFEALVEEGMIGEDDLELFRYCETAEQAWEILTTFNGKASNGKPGTPNVEI